MAAKKKSAGKNQPKARAELPKMSPADVRPPPIPVYHLLGEARALDKIAHKYGKELRRVGIASSLLASLSERTDLLSHLQGELALVRKSRRSKQEIAQEADAIELRRDMIADGRYALRDDADAQATLDHVQEGEGLDDLVQDLRDMAAFHTQHKAVLSKIGVKAEARAKAARALAEALGETLAGRRTGDVEEKTALDLRNRASTSLVGAMREIRAAGIYALRKDPDLVGRFRGTYFAKHRAGKKPAPAKAVPANGQPSTGNAS
jgi:hypothetical protein